MTALLRATTLFLLVKLGALLVNLVQFPVLDRPRRPAPRCTSVVAVPDPAEQVSLLVPLRNEADRLAASLPGLVRQDVAELILLDDCSSDETVSIARALIAGRPHVRLVSGAPLPAGWVGKNWACHQLAEHASGSKLVFCDADVQLAPGAVEQALIEMDRQRAEVFSVFPRQLTGTLGEHLITPLIDDVLLCFLPFGLLSLHVPAAATANGSLLVFSRAAYGYLGGFESVRAEIVEDVALARRARSGGLKLGLALGGAAVQTRMYDGYPSVVAGLSRGLLPMAGGSRLRLLLGLAWHLAVYSLPPLLIGRRRGWLLPWSLALLERALVEVKTGRELSWQIFLPPLSPLAAVPVVARALRGRPAWRGRSYS